MQLPSAAPRRNFSDLNRIHLLSSANSSSTTAKPNISKFLSSFSQFDAHEMSDMLKSLWSHARGGSLWRSPYQYMPIASDGTEIRLLRLKQSRTRNEPIRIELLHAKLDDELDFYALSYTWGSATFPHIILADDKVLSCTSNLHSALQHLRRRSEDLVMWIDAICIDQSNLEERSQQVGIMRSIYQRASQVIVWLGPSSSQTEMAMKLIFKLRDHRQDRKYIKKKISDPKSLKGFEAIIKLFTLDYWYRAWVVQEVCSAKNIIVYCGNFSIPWQDLVSVQKMLEEDYDNEILAISSSNPAMRSTISRRGPYLLRLIDRDLRAEPPDLFEIVIKHITKQASDPRDKIYAFVGVSNEDKSYPIDYSLPVSQVYMHFVQHIIVQSKTLDVICAVPWNGNDSSVNLPSWVPNWGMENPYIEYFLDPVIRSRYTVCASGSSNAQVQFDLEEGSILVQGGSIDTISDIGSINLAKYSNDLELALTAIFSWWYLSKSLMGTSVQSQEAFARTLCFDRISPEHLRRGETKEEHLQWILGALSTLALELDLRIDLDDTLQASTRLHDWSSSEARGNAMSWIHGISDDMLFRRFCVSESRTPAIVPNLAEVGDKICILLGCSFPVILRAVDDHYVLIGCAYVDGYMQGEAMEKIQIQDFKIL